MKENNCYTYFAIKGDFKTDEISKKLNLTPTKKWDIGDKRKNGTVYDFSLWEYGRCKDKDIFLENLMFKTIKDLLPLKEELLKIMKEFDVSFTLQVVAEFYKDEEKPCLNPSRDIIKFLYETETDLDIDYYVL